MNTFSPTATITSVNNTHNLNLSESGSGESLSSGHAEKEWHYYTNTKTKDLENVVRDIYQELKTQVTKKGANIHGNSEASHAFIVYSFTYTHNGREGRVQIIAANLDKGTGIDIFLDEHPK